MESGELLELSVSRDIETRRVLSLRSAEAFRNGISVIDSPMNQKRLLTSLGRGQVVWHRLGGTRRRNMSRSRANDDGWGQPGVGATAIGAGGASETLRGAASLSNIGEVRWLRSTAVIATMTGAVRRKRLVANVVQCRRGG